MIAAVPARAYAPAVELPSFPAEAAVRTLAAAFLVVVTLVPGALAAEKGYRLVKTAPVPGGGRPAMVPKTFAVLIYEK